MKIVLILFISGHMPLNHDYGRVTPLKFNMEPANQPLEKEIRFHGKHQECFFGSMEESLRILWVFLS